MIPIPEISPIEWFLRMLALAFGMLFLGTQTTITEPPPPAETTFTRIPHVIENVESVVLESQPVQVKLVVNGYQPDGCDYPVQVGQRRLGTTLYVDIYRELPADVACTANIVPYQAEILLEGEFANEYYMVMVNNFTLWLDFEQGMEKFKVPHLVTSVEVGKYPSLAAYPSALYLKVSSTIDGCDYPTQISQRQEGYAVYVELYRELPIGIACPAIAKFIEEEIPLEGEFERGLYTFYVNGVEVTYTN